MRWFLAFSLLFSLPAFAAKQYRVDAEVFLGEQLLAKPRLVLTEGKKGVISQAGRGSQVSLTMLLKPQKGEGILLRSQLEVVSEGKKRAAAPQLLVREGQDASMTVEEKGGKITLKVKVSEEKPLSRLTPPEEAGLDKALASMPSSGDDYLEDLEISGN